MPAAPAAADDGAARVAPVVVIAAFAGVFAAVFLAALAPVADGDIFWHLAAGREMVARGAWLHTDPFTVSAAGRTWLDVHWLFQLGAWALYRVGGLGALVLVKAALVAGGAVALVALARRLDGTMAAALAALGLAGALFLGRHLVLVRPVVVTLVMMALFLAALEAVRSTSDRRRRRLLLLVALPLLQVVWANCQGLSALGPGLVAAYLAGAVLGERELPRRTLAAALGLVLAAMLATPYGWGGLTLPLRLLARIAPASGNVFAIEVAENVSPLVLARTAPGEVAPFFAYLAALAACLALAGRRPPASRLLMVGGLVLLALAANRNVLLLYWLATPIAAVAVAPRARALAARVIAAGTRRRVPGLAPALAIAALAAPLAVEVSLAATAFAREPSIAEPTPFHFPVESSRFLAAALARAPHPGPLPAGGGERVTARSPRSVSVFAPDHHGGYLALSVPGLRPYIDTRLVLHTAEEYAAYLEAVADPEKFDELDAAADFQYVVLTTAYPDRYLGLVRHLATSRTGRWRLVFTDGVEVLFARAGDPIVPRTSVTGILADLERRHGRHPEIHAAARLHLGRLLVALGESRAAEEALGSSSSRAAVELRARARLAAGDLAAAESLARTLIAEPRAGRAQPDDGGEDAHTLALLAQIALAGGHPQSGLGWLRRALTADPHDGEARTLLQQIEARVGRSGASVSDSE